MHVSTSLCFVLHHEVSVYKEAKHEFVEHKKAFVHIQSQFVGKFDPCTRRIYLEGAKLFEGMQDSARYTATKR